MRTTSLIWVRQALASCIALLEFIVGFAQGLVAGFFASPGFGCRVSHLTWGFGSAPRC